MSLKTLCRWSLLPIVAVQLVATLAVADPFPPYWDGGAGPAVHFSPAPWPAEPANAADCGIDCGDWRPYTRFQRDMNDPRVQDPSNGGTSPQNYVNIASSCIDTSLPSIYYSLQQGATPAEDVIMFRWRVEQIANTYATGPNAGSFGASSPWNSALWTVLFDVDGNGFRDLAAHLDGSSGSPSAAVDRLAGIWGTIPTQSVDYSDPSIHLLAHNPTAFVDQGTGRILNFNNSVSPTASWPNGSAETIWDYGTTRARRVSTNSCNEYFIDYQIPVAMLDASGLGGPSITRSTPIAMLFCTANSLNNPFQKDCAIDKTWAADPNRPAPFGDYLSFDQDEPFEQPIISRVTATAPTSCSDPRYTLSARVQDTIAIVNGTAVPSVQAVVFHYWYDANGNGLTDEAGGSWTSIAPMATLKPGTLNTWTLDWDASSLLRGRYLIGVQAVDGEYRDVNTNGVYDPGVDVSLLDNGMTVTENRNRTFSYLSPDQVSAMTPPANETWFGNPEVIGQQVATAGVDLALNACGVAPQISKTASPSAVTPGESVVFTVTVGNDTGNPIAIDRIDDTLPAGFTLQSTDSLTNGGASQSTTAAPGGGDSGTLTWTFPPGTTIATGTSLVLQFTAQAGAVAGQYNNTASAETDFGTLVSDPAPVSVDAARISLSKTPSTYLIAPDGSTPLQYTLRYANDASVDLTDAAISDTLPPGVTFVGCSGGLSCGLSGGVVTWQLGPLTGGATGSVGLTVTVNPNYSQPSLTNTAQLSATPPSGPPVTTGASSTIAVDVPPTPEPAFTLEKTASAVQIAPAGSVTWTLAYHNYGTAAATGVLITDELPAGFTFSGCSVAGSAHFLGCGATGDTVTFHNGAGSGVSVPAGASGSVTITATAAAAPFTYPNPAVNTATIAWAENPASVTASASVGVSGPYCSAVYYFHPGGVADETPPTATTATVNTFTINSSTPASITFQSQPLAAPLTVNGDTLTVNFYLSATQGSNSFQVTLRNQTQGTTIAQSALSSIGNTNGNPQLFTFTATAGQNVNAGDVLVWRFDFTTGAGASRNVGFYYDSTTLDSRSSFCSPSAPASLVVAKRVDSPLLSSLPASLQYTIDFANTGGTAATGVSIVDTLPAGVSFVSATLNGASVTPTINGQQLTFSNVRSSTDATPGQVSAGTSGTLMINATVASGASGPLVNTATVSGSGLAPVSDTAETAIGGSSGGGGSPALVVSKQVDTSFLGADETATYTLTVVNVGTGSAGPVQVSDTLPSTAYFAYVPGSIAGGSSRNDAGNPLLWTIDTLAVGQSVELSYQMRTTASGIPAGVTLLDNTANLSDPDFCTGSPLPEGCASNTVTVTVSGNPELALTKSASLPTPPAASFAPGDTIEYTLTLSNVGSATASDVTVTDPIPADTAFGAITQGTGSFDAVNNRVVFNVGSLAGGASVTLRFTVTLNAVLDDGQTTVTNTASASASNAAGRTDSADSTADAAPVMTLTKTAVGNVPLPATVLTADAAGATTLFVDGSDLLSVSDTILVNGTLAQVIAVSGNTVSVDTPVTAASGTPVLLGVDYSLVYENTGNAIAANVTVTDPLPAGWLYVDASPAATSAPAVGSNGTVNWSVGSVEPGESGVLYLTAVPTASGSATNTATVTADGGISEQASAVTLTGGLTVDKLTTTPTIAAGGTADYVITISNSTAAAVNGVEVHDLLATGFSYLTGTGVPAPTGLDGSDPSRPFWTVDVPANGSVTIQFSAQADAGVGPATYQNEVEVIAPGGVGVVPFDALSTTAEDVTVLGSGTGLVDGVVFVDNNANGVFDASVDTPLAGATVTITDALSTVYIVATDSSGYFSRVVAAGSASVDVDDADVPAGLVLTTGSTDPTTVTVPDGGSVTDDTGYRVAGSVGSVGGLVFLDDGSGGGTSGDGLPNGGEAPVSGVTVQLLDTADNVVLTTTTGGDGRYAFADVPVGDYRVRIIAPDGHLVTTTPHPADITVTAGATVERDFGVLPVPTSALSGTVFNDLDSSGTPDGAEPGTDGGGLNVVVVDGSDTVLAVAVVGADGSWSAQVPQGTGYSVFVTTANPTPGDTLAPSVNLQPGWVLSDVNNGIRGGVDASGNQTGLDFGIRQVSGPDVFTTIDLPPQVEPGGPITALLVFGNQGGALADGVTYTVTGLPTGLAQVDCQGASCAYDSGTGELLLSGLPATLSPGQQLVVVLGFTAPGSGSVTLTSTIATTTAGDPTGNNSASDATLVATTVADMTTAVIAPATAVAGETVNATVTYVNLGSADAQNVGFTVTGLPAGATVSYGGVPCTYDPGSGAVTGCGLPATVGVGEIVELVVSYTAPASGTVTVVSTVTADNDADPDNNAASASTLITSVTQADVTAQVAAPGTAAAGSTVQVTVTFANLGPAAADGVTYSLTLTGSPTDVSCGGGVVCSFDPGTGIVTITGLPTTLQPGQQLPITLSYTAPASGTVQVDATIGTSTPEITTANNASSGITLIEEDPAPTPVRVAGRVFDDTDGSGLINGSEAGTNAGGVFALLVLPDGTLSASSPVAADGQFSFDAVLPGAYRIWLATGAGTLGVQAPVPALPSGYVPTGESLDGVTLDGVVDGVLNVTVAGVDVGGLTLGIQRPQSAPDVYTAIRLPARVGPWAPLTGIVTYGNHGPAVANDVTYTVRGFPGGISQVACRGAACTYDPITRTLTFHYTRTLTSQALPDSIGAGYEAEVSFTFRAPSGGTVSLTSVIETSSIGDPLPNNTATASTSIVGSGVIQGCGCSSASGSP